MAAVIDWLGLGTVVVAAAVFDVRTRRVPNALTLTATVAGMICSTVGAGWSGLATSASGFVVGLALFMPFFVLGGMGGGDVKLLAAVGAWLGPIGVFWAACWSAIAGGVAAVLISLWTGYLGTALRNLTAAVAVWRTVGPSPIPDLTLASGRGPRLAYAVPIAVGALLALGLHRP